MARNETEFFTLLRNKLEKKPGRAFDQTFWKRFHEEFNVKTNSGPHRLWLTAGIAALMLITIVTRWKTAPDAAIVTDAEVIKNLLKQAPLLKDLDLFLTHASPDGAENLPELSEQEWRILLEGQNR